MRGVIGVGASVALHAAVAVAAMAWLPRAAGVMTSVRSSGMAATTTATDEVAFDVARGTDVPSASPDEAAVTAAAKAEKAEKAEKRPRRGRSAAASEAGAGTAAEAVAAPEAVAEAATESVAGSVSASGSASGSVSESVTGSVSESAPGLPGPDPNAIRTAIARIVSYPRLARSQGLEGTVTVRFHIDRSGSASDLSVVTSAGRLLDAAARDAIVRAAPYRSPPGWVRVPVIFSLHDAP